MRLPSHPQLHPQLHSQLHPQLRPLLHSQLISRTGGVISGAMNHVRPAMLLEAATAKPAFSWAGYFFFSS